MLILFLKRLVILGLFFMFFFFACENKWQTPIDSTFNSGVADDDDDDSPTRTRRRSSSSGGSSGGSSSSGSSSGGSSDDGLGGHGDSTTGGTVGGSTTGRSSGSTTGSSTGGTGGSKVYDGECPDPSSSLEDYPSLTTLTFKLYTEDLDPYTESDSSRECYNSKYSHPHFNFGQNHFGGCDCDCICSSDRSDHYSGGHGSASNNQNTILRYTTDSGIEDGQVIYLNGKNIGQIHSANRYYIYFKKGSGSIDRTEIKMQRLKKRFSPESFRWSSCACNGNPSYKVTQTKELKEDYDPRSRRRYKFIVKGCQRTPIKFWLATEERWTSTTSCRFHTP